MATSTKQAPALTTRQRNENILWHALAKEAERHAVRGALVDGDVHQVTAAIAGKVDRKKVILAIGGELTVGHENPTGSASAPSGLALLGHVLGLVPEGQRSQVSAHLKKQLLEPGKLREPAAELLALAEQILLDLKKIGPKRGAVQFRPTA